MAHLFYRLGRAAAPHLAKAKWVFEAATGDDASRIQAEYEAGLHLAHAYRARAPRDEDPATARLLDEIGGRLTARLVNKQRRYSFQGVLVPEANALALPGGFIFISRPLMELCDFSRDEIAFVLAHEAGHVVLQHTFKRYLAASATGAVRKASRMRSPTIQAAGAVVGNLIDKGYSRDQEFEADRFGHRLCEAAGFDPGGAGMLLERLRSVTSDEEGMARYFATHPPIEERIGRLERDGTRDERVLPVE